MCFFCGGKCNFKSKSCLFLAGSVLAAVGAVVGALGFDLYLASTQWLLVAGVLAIWAVFFKEK